MLLDPETIQQIAESVLQQIKEENFKKAAELSKKLSSTRIASILVHTDKLSAGKMLSMLDKKRAGRVIANMHQEFAVQIMESLEETERAKLINSIPADNLNNLLEAADNEFSEKLYNLLKSDLKNHLDKIREYPSGSAGRIMSPYFLTARGDGSVRETIESMLSAPPEVEGTPYIYVLDQAGELTGVMSIKDMLREDPERKLKEVMNPGIVTVKDTDSAHEASDIIRNRRLMMLPVVDSNGHIVGVITFDDAMKVLTKDAAKLIVSSSAIVQDESFFTPPMRAVKGRLPWMAANVFLNMGAVAVITGFEATIATVAILAAFIPMITDMGGNVGIQSLSVAIRSIALGGVKMRDIRKVIKKEILIGIVNGIALGMLFAVIAYILRGNPYLGLLAGAALGINVLVAGIVGGALPFLIKAIGKDPAMMTGPVLTTITDITGVSIYLGLSTMFIAFLV